MPRVVDHEQRRRELVDAALRLVVTDGLEGATVRNIAREAGCSIRPVQYYFADKAALLAAAHARVTERLGARVAAAIAALGPSPEPRRIGRAVVRSFLPLDAESRDGMIVYYAFYAAELTNPRVRIPGAVGAPNAIASILSTQIRRHFGRRKPPFQVDREALLLVVAVPSVASGVIAGYLSLRDAETLLNHGIDRLFP
jgi:TetR/AcrR family transcriptional repressor of bet genes